MVVDKNKVEQVEISFGCDEYEDALEYCTQGRYTIQKITPKRDARSDKYTGTAFMVATRLVKESEE